MRTPLYGLAAGVIAATLGITGVAIASSTPTTAPPAPPGAGRTVGTPLRIDGLGCPGQSVTGEALYGVGSPRDPRSPDRIIADIAAMHLPASAKATSVTAYQQFSPAGREMVRHVRLAVGGQAVGQVFMADPEDGAPQLVVESYTFCVGG